MDGVGNRREWNMSDGMFVVGKLLRGLHQNGFWNRYDLMRNVGGFDYSNSYLMA